MREILNTLYVQTERTVLHLEGDAVLARFEDRPPQRAPLLRLEAIVLIGKVSVTTPLVHRCAAEGRAIVWLRRSGHYAGRLVGPMSGNVLLRQAQWDAHRDASRRLQIARTVVAGKVQNLLRLARSLARRSSSPSVSAPIRERVTALEILLGQLGDAADLDVVRGVEGQASRLSFQNLRQALTASLDFGVRSRRPPRDPTNALLSFLYSLVRTRTEAACETVGLDPQVGYLHALRPGRAALALDLMEEFRPDIDRLALTLANKRQITAKHFDHQPGGAYQLTDDGRQRVISAWYEELTRPVDHRVLRHEVPWGLLPQVQATLLARHLREDLEHYMPYVTRIE